jgi:hypothetical protein
LFLLKPIVKQMPAKSKKILVTTEQHEVLIVRRNRQNIIGFCPECGREVKLLTFDEVTSTTGQPARELVRLIEKDLVHSIETESGHLLICRNSLKESGGKTKP